MGAQQGLVLSLTKQGYAVHWPGVKPEPKIPDSPRLIGMVEILPYQDGEEICEDGPTEIIGSSSLAESDSSTSGVLAREVFMVRPRSPLVRPQAPDVIEGEETEEVISQDQPPQANETDEQRLAGSRKTGLGTSEDRELGLVKRHKTNILQTCESIPVVS